MLCKREAVEHLRREDSALPFHNHASRLVHHIGVLVYTLAHQRIIDIDDGHDLRPDGDLIALEAVGITISVIPLS